MQRGDVFDVEVGLFGGIGQFNNFNVATVFITDIHAVTFFSLHLWPKYS